jgi:hypothetical protein
MSCGLEKFKGSNLMDNVKFEMAVKAAGGKIGLLNKGAYNAIQGMVKDDEQMIAAAESIDGKGAGAIVVTNKTFYGVKFTGMFSSEKVVLPLPGIGSVSLSGGAFSKALNITDGTRTYSFPQVSNPDAILAAIQAGKNTPVSQTAAITSLTDPTTELRKYKTLLDDGIITQEDFDKKKAALLGL